MVSIEEEMKQKDKEAAVLKANHKYEILLNIELERIEKCKRTYENFHNFEVSVMRHRQHNILQKQLELRKIVADSNFVECGRHFGLLERGKTRYKETCTPKISKAQQNDQHVQRNKSNRIRQEICAHYANNGRKHFGTKTVKNNWARNDSQVHQKLATLTTKRKEMFPDFKFRNYRTKTPLKASHKDSSPFDQFRKRLDESCRRTAKRQVKRLLSAQQDEKFDLTTFYRTRSADAQITSIYLM